MDKDSNLWLDQCGNAYFKFVADTPYPIRDDLINFAEKDEKFSGLQVCVAKLKQPVLPRNKVWESYCLISTDELYPLMNRLDDYCCANSKKLSVSNENPLLNTLISELVIDDKELTIMNTYFQAKISEPSDVEAQDFLKILPQDNVVVQGASQDSAMVSASYFLENGSKESQLSRHNQLKLNFDDIYANAVVGTYTVKKADSSVDSQND